MLVLQGEKYVDRDAVMGEDERAFLFNELGQTPYQCPIRSPLRDAACLCSSTSGGSGSIKITRQAKRQPPEDVLDPIGHAGPRRCRHETSNSRSGLSPGSGSTCSHQVVPPGHRGAGRTPSSCLPPRRRSYNQQSPFGPCHQRPRRQVRETAWLSSYPRPR